MEILAFLLIGLIAMLAIVPPIIRGKINASPLSTTESFQRSMFQMGTSLDLDAAPEDHARVPLRYTTALPTSAQTARAVAWQPVEQEIPDERISRPPSAARARSKVSVKRNRILGTFALAAAGSALLALAIDNRTMLVLFVISCVLLVSYCLLLLLVPAFLRARRKAPRLPGRMSLRRG